MRETSYPEAAVTFFALKYWLHCGFNQKKLSRPPRHRSLSYDSTACGLLVTSKPRLESQPSPVLCFSASLLSLLVKQDTQLQPRDNNGAMSDLRQARVCFLSDPVFLTNSLWKKPKAHAQGKLGYFCLRKCHWVAVPSAKKMPSEFFGLLQQECHVQ